jgi:hypothetical protein
MIRETVLDTVPVDSADSAPSGVLRVHITDEFARLTWSATELPDHPPPALTFQVSARSLLLALRAAWDAAHPGRSDLDPAAPPRRERPAPPNSRQPWTAALDTVLRETWLTGTESTPATELIGRLAGELGRSRGGIRARLARLGLDPDVPGRVLREEE